MIRSKRSRQKKKNSFVYWLVVLIIAVVIMTGRMYEEIGPEKKPGERFKIVKVIDGDTVELAGGDRLRLLAIDTPEKGEPFYSEAKQFLKAKALDKIARLEYGSTRRDRYGRLLGYLYIDDLFINKQILENGLGYLYLFKRNDLKQDKVKLMLTSQINAIDNKLGIWSIKHQAEKYYLAAAKSFRLHRPGCRSLRQANEDRYRRFETRIDGFTIGLSPCRNCKP